MTVRGPDYDGPDYDGPDFDGPDYDGSPCRLNDDMSDESGREELQTKQEEKDLGVLVRSDLKPSTQCVQVATKARKITGVTRRNFGRLDRTDFLIIYKTYMRLHL